MVEFTEIAENGTINWVIQRYPVNLEKCNLTVHFSDNMDMWRDQKLINDSICFSKNQSVPLESRYLFGDLNYTGIVTWIHKCINTTEDQTCASEEEIQKTLSNVFFYVRFKDYYYDHSILGDPAKEYVYSDLVMASSTAYKRIWYYMKNVEYFDDNGFIFSGNTIYNYTSFAGSRESTDLRTIPTIPGTFAAVSLNGYTSVQKYFRKYYKAQNMIADLGGIIKSILVLAMLLNYYFEQKYYYLDLINSNIEHYCDKISLDRFWITNSDVRQKSSTFVVNQNETKLKLNENTGGNLAEINNIKVESNIHNKQRILLKAQTNARNNTQTINRKKIFEKETGKKEKILKLSKSLIILPSCCIKTRNHQDKVKYELMNRYSEYIIKQLDVNYLLDKFNTIDKLKYIFAGKDYKDSFDECINPYIDLLEETKNISDNNHQSSTNFVRIQNNLTKLSNSKKLVTNMSENMVKMLNRKI
jgi:hypothetical protein